MSGDPESGAARHPLDDMDARAPSSDARTSRQQAEHAHHLRRLPRLLGGPEPAGCCAESVRPQVQCTSSNGIQPLWRKGLLRGEAGRPVDFPGVRGRPGLGAGLALAVLSVVEQRLDAVRAVLASAEVTHGQTRFGGGTCGCGTQMSAKILESK